MPTPQWQYTFQGSSQEGPSVGSVRGLLEGVCTGRLQATRQCQQVRGRLYGVSRSDLMEANRTEIAAGVTVT